MLSRDFGGKLEHGLVQPHLGFVNCELGRMDTNRHSSSPGCEVVASECSLVPLIQTTPGI